MHDLDRNRLEIGEVDEYEAGEYEGEYEFEYEGEFEDEGELGVPLSESQETELASELLELGSEQELEGFFRDLIGSAARAAGSFVRSDTGRALGRVLKRAAKQALPIAGRAIGQWVSPKGGGAVGARVGRAVGTAFGLELEGLSGEDREFEVARAVVRFADAAARQAAVLTPRNLPVQATVARAVATAARQHAPGLVPAGAVPAAGGGRRRSGRWVRRGRKLVIFDA